jgi:hypothetical protein
MKPSQNLFGPCRNGHWESLRGLLQGPGSGRMRGDIEVKDTSRPNLHHHKHIQDAEPGLD